MNRKEVVFRLSAGYLTGREEAFSESIGPKKEGIGFMASKAASLCVIKISDLTRSQKRKLLNGAPHHNNTGGLRSFCNGFGQVNGYDADEETIRRLLRKVQKKKRKKQAHCKRRETTSLRLRNRRSSFCLH